MAGGVVMEQRQRLRACFLRDHHRVLDRAVPPRGLLGEFGDGVLRVVDHEVGPVTELERTFGDRVAAVVGLLMVGDVGDRRALPLDAVAVGRPDVGNAARHDLRGADRELVVGAGMERERADERVHRDREERRPDAEVERIEQVDAVVLHRRVHVEVAAGEDRHEERKPLHMVPVQVADQRRSFEAAVEWLGLAEVPQARPHVQDDGFLAGYLDSDAGCVSAVSARPFA